MNRPLNPHVANTVPSPITEAYSWLEDAPAGMDVIDVAQAVPGYPPHPDLIDRVAADLADPAISRYGPVLGMPEVRDAFAADITRSYGAPVASSQVAITAGCNQAFVLAITALCQPGDEVILAVPYYFNHDMWLRIAGITPVYMPCDARMNPRLDLLEVTERTRALVLISPNNPTGAVYSPQFIADAFEACQAQGIRLIMDETYRDFRSTTEPAHGLFGSDWTDTFVHLYSFSKAFSITGYRTGAMAVSEELLYEIDKIADCLTICPPRPGQAAALFGMKHLSGWVDGNRVLMNTRVERFRDLMAGVPGWEIRSAGAYFAYVQHPFESHTGREVARSLLTDHGVLSLAGEMFGPGQEQFLRLAFANLDDDTIPDLVNRLAAFVP